MDMSAKTPNERLKCEAHYNQGYQDGISAALQMIQKRGITYAQGIEDGVRSVTGPNIERCRLALEAIFKAETEGGKTGGSPGS